jgi:hypothetical protein
VTSETRVFIEPEDVLGVEFECMHCHGRFLYRLPDKPVRILSTCPNCNEPFYGPTGMESFQQFFALLTAMPRLADKEKLTIRIQIREPMQPSASRKSEPER